MRLEIPATVGLLTTIERMMPVMSLATLALGLVFFGLFYGLVIACDHL